MSWLRAFWQFLSDEQHQKTLAWLGAGIIAISAALYGGYKTISSDADKATKANSSAEVVGANSTKGDCSPIIGNVSGGNISLDCSSKKGGSQ